MADAVLRFQDPHRGRCIESTALLKEFLLPAQPRLFQPWSAKRLLGMSAQMRD